MIGIVFVCSNVLEKTIQYETMFSQKISKLIQYYADFEGVFVFTQIMVSSGQMTRDL